MATTSVRLIGPGDLGSGLKVEAMKLVARTIVKQAEFDTPEGGGTYMIDSNGRLLVLEKWRDMMTFEPKVNWTTRRFNLEDFDFDTAGDTFSLKANSVVGTINNFVGDPTQVFAAEIDAGSTLFKDAVIVDDGQGLITLTYDKPISDYEYVLAQRWDGEVTYEPLPYTAPVMAITIGAPKVLVCESIVLSMSNTGMSFDYSTLGNIVNTAPIVYPRAAIAWADWNNPTQADLDASTQDALWAGWNQLSGSNPKSGELWCTQYMALRPVIVPPEEPAQP